MGATDPQQNPQDAFLLEDFKHWAESYFRNEAAGDTRLGFFVGVIAAVFAAVGVLAKAGEEIHLEKVRVVGTAAVVGLFLLGMLTLLRVLRRNRVTNGYLHALNRIRAHFVHDQALLEDYMRKVPRSPARLASFGGVAHVVAILNVALVFAGTWIASVSSFPGGPMARLALGAIGAALAFLVQQRLIERSEGQAPKADAFRANVGLLVVNPAGKVLVMERGDVAEPAWQLPQGGIEAGERPEDAAWRELHEETGFGPDDVRDWKVGARWLAYELPPEYRKPKTGRGQVQKWVLLHLKESVGERLPVPPSPPRSASVFGSLSLAGEPEARSFRWVSWREVLERAAPFRRPVYEQLPSEFPELRPD